MQKIVQKTIFFLENFQRLPQIERLLNEEEEELDKDTAKLLELIERYDISDQEFLICLEQRDLTNLFKNR